MTKPAWFTQLQHDLVVNASIMVPDGAAIDWDRCRNLFLISLLRRLESRSNSPHPAIVRGLLQRRLAGEDVTAELSAAAAASDSAAGAYWAAASASDSAAASAASAASDPVASDWAAASAASDWAAATVERADQLADLHAAVAAATQPQTLPANYIDADITGPDRELLSAFYSACNSEGGTADEIHLRGIRAVLAQAATGITAPTPVEGDQ